ncbi:hypothetical protein E4U30_008210 [Claviceps sp. LM220 group G6]|nr:hypothetical protein E4U30_008210 [Claviceps sp. LM220 group G6]
MSRLRLLESGYLSSQRLQEVEVGQGRLMAMTMLCVWTLENWLLELGLEDVNVLLKSVQLIRAGWWILTM